MSWPWPVEAEPDYLLNTSYAPITWVAVPVVTGLTGLVAAWRLYREKFGKGISKSKHDRAGC